MIAVCFLYTLRCTFHHHLRTFLNCTIEIMTLLSSVHFTFYASCDPSFCRYEVNEGSGEPELLIADGFGPCFPSGFWRVQASFGMTEGGVHVTGSPSHLDPRPWNLCYI